MVFDILREEQKVRIVDRVCFMQEWDQEQTRERHSGSGEAKQLANRNDAGFVIGLRMERRLMRFDREPPCGFLVSITQMLLYAARPTVPL